MEATYRARLCIDPDASHCLPATSDPGERQAVNTGPTPMLNEHQVLSILTCWLILVKHVHIFIVLQHQERWNSML
jgi:hypothetical protein